MPASPLDSAFVSPVGAGVSRSSTSVFVAGGRSSVEASEKVTVVFAVFVITPLSAAVAFAAALTGIVRVIVFPAASASCAGVSSVHVTVLPDADAVPDAVVGEPTICNVLGTASVATIDAYSDTSAGTFMEIVYSAVSSRLLRIPSPSDFTFVNPDGASGSPISSSVFVAGSGSAGGSGIDGS